MSNAAPVIIPRWEYRTFGESFGEAEANIRSHGEAKARSSAETYIVSFDSPNNTKIRDGLMDIKKLENVNADTLEQWNPVLKSGFPLDARGPRPGLRGLGRGDAAARPRRRYRSRSSSPRSWRRTRASARSRSPRSASASRSTAASSSSRT